MAKQDSPGAKLTPEHTFFEIIEEAYRVFDYPKPESLEVCQHCCMEPDIEADFLNPPIRELPLRYVQDWYFAAADPDGIAKATWAYLLPRILEILAADDCVANVGTEVSLKRFETGNPENWTEDEWRVLDAFQRTYLEREIERTEEYLDDTICMFALGGWSVDDLFAQVLNSPDDVLARRFWHDWCSFPGPGSIWITAFWEGSGGTAAFSYYTSEALYVRMSALGLNEETAPELAGKALDVAGVIETANA